ncbi:unnamed protein product [Amaranthus hypochondriacus]
MMLKRWILRDGLRRSVGIRNNESLFPTLEGHPAAQTHAKEALEHSTSMIENKGMKEFRIYRWNPQFPNHKPFLQSYFLDLSICGPMVLDALQKIKAEDDSNLSYRRSCREGICVSCSMNIDGLIIVACLKPIDSDTTKPTTLTPLPHMFVIKDLVVDLTNFYDQYKSTEPWLKTRKRPKNGREYRQSPQDRKKLDGLYECILCACCTTACPAYWWNPEEYLGPAALINAYRWVSDSREDYTVERLEALLADDKKLDRCRSIKNCTAACPKSFDPASAINIMRARHKLSVRLEKN